MFAPGHLGELTQYLPFELVDDILERTKTVQRRLRDLPSRVGVYFLLALGMYPRLGYARVWAKLTAGLEGLEVPCPSEKALRDLRRRLGPGADVNPSAICQLSRAERADLAHYVRGPVTDDRSCMHERSVFADYVLTPTSA